MKRGAAAAKINLALVVGPQRGDGRHELLTVYQRIALADRLVVSVASEVKVEGFAEDTLVARALESVAADNGTKFSARLTKRIPVSSGLGGGSSDAATALRLANELRDDPYDEERLHELACSLGADVPYFLRDGPQLGSGDGTVLEPLDLPQDYWVLLVLPRGHQKRSTADVYAEFDARQGERDFDERRKVLHDSLANVSRPRHLEALPPNDLASSPLSAELRALGAFRADVSGAGPIVFGLFVHSAEALRARKEIARKGRTWLTAPAWYR